ncbi:hypothetical protein GGU10DRAFT_412685 [Lentinula aff. detonsa]|uniref:Bromodomain-containing protein n=1 Tax=Lentinula aff. detonsa TaxID=2804958 RepID=A0AA38KGH7_9AGAR|nr:hypothetical protein GGU10DRAFT_412685 [Lentinula aff. detonsa]
MSKLHWAPSQVFSYLNFAEYVNLKSARQDLELCFNNAIRYNQPESLIYNDAKDLVKLTTSEYERDSHKEEKTRWKNERRMLEEIQQATGGTDAMLAEVRQTMQGMQEQLYAKENKLRQLQMQLSQSQSQLSQTQSQLSQLERLHAEAVEDLDTGRGVI